jgi:Cu/Ag efflux pump CusA
MNFILTPCICVSHVTVTVTWFDSPPIFQFDTLTLQLRCPLHFCLTLSVDFLDAQLVVLMLLPALHVLLLKRRQLVKAKLWIYAVRRV